VPDGPGKPDKIRIDHILEGDAPEGEGEEGVIEVVSDEEAPPAASPPRDAGAPAPEPPPDAGADPLEAARREIEDLRDQYVRVRADFENFRKRVERDRAEERARVSAGVVLELLPALDNLDRALGQEADDPGFRQGVVLIRRQIDETLRRLGVEPIEALGESFDPIYHEAMAAEPREGFAPHTIIEEIRKGYTLGGRVIRPTLVKVAVPPPTAAADSSGGTGASDGQDHRD
jgi:molecular chaperone GrpE